MNRLCALVLSTSLALLATTSYAQDPAAARLQMRALAATCAACHGTDGRGLAGSAMVPLAGMPKAYMENQLKEFKEGKRPGTVMPQLAKGYTDPQIDSLAAYFAAVPAQAAR